MRSICLVNDIRGFRVSIRVYPTKRAMNRAARRHVWACNTDCGPFENVPAAAHQFYSEPENIATLVFFEDSTERDVLHECVHAAVNIAWHSRLRKFWRKYGKWGRDETVCELTTDFFRVARSFVRGCEKPSDTGLSGGFWWLDCLNGDSECQKSSDSLPA